LKIFLFLTASRQLLTLPRPVRLTGPKLLKTKETYPKF
jgi:hypothetical protein